jgi:hypothetical protein
MKRIDWMYFPGVCCVLLMLGLLGSLNAREFTNKDGKTMEAKLVGVAGAKATFERSSGKAFSYAIAQLSEDDQAYIKKWAKTNVTIDLEVTKCQSVVIRKRGVGTGGTKRTIESRGYEITIRNKGKQPMGGVLCCYSLFTKMNNRLADKSEDKVQVLDPKHAKFEIPTLAPGEEKTITTKSVIVGKTNTYERKGDFNYISNYTIKLSGGNFGFFLGDRSVREHYEGSHKEAGLPKPEDLDDGEEEKDDEEDDNEL